MNKLRLAFFIALICLVAPHAARAQSTLMNVPSTEVVSPRQVYVEMDFITNYAWERGDSAFQSYIPRTVIGVGKNIEAGVNVSFTHVPGGGKPIELQPNAKWQIYNNEGIGIAAAIGCIGYIPITHRTETRSIAQCYAVGSKQFKGRYGPRFTGGGYALINARNEKTKAGAIVAYEQPLVPNVDFIVDWFSGDNRFGYVSPGLSFTMPHDGALSLGYLMANHGRGKNALFAYYGVTF